MTPLVCHARELAVALVNAALSDRAAGPGNREWPVWRTAAAYALGGGMAFTAAAAVVGGLLFWAGAFLMNWFHRTGNTRTALSGGVLFWRLFGASIGGGLVSVSLNHAC